MKPYVLDSSALIAYIVNETGADIVDQILSDTHSICHAHAINLCEVFYNFVRSRGVAEADRLITDIHSVGVVEHSKMTGAFWRKVGFLKAKGRISLADCFCIVLAQELGATILTADHHEFDAIAAQNIVPIRFIR